MRERTDALDSWATPPPPGKGFAIGSAGLTALALIAAYRDQISIVAPDMNLAVSLMNPAVLVGLFIGGMLPFVFSAMTMQAVGRAAEKIVEEVRRQFKEIPGLMEGKAKPDYASCVGLCTAAAQREMVPPALLAIVAPIVVGVLLGVEGVAGLLVGTVVTGFLLAVMMANAGGTWTTPRAHRVREIRRQGFNGSQGRRGRRHRRRPCKDTAGPSLNILIS